MLGNDFIILFKCVFLKWVYDYVLMFGWDYQMDEEWVFDINWYQCVNLNNVMNFVFYFVID